MPIRVILVFSAKKCIESLKPFFEEEPYSYRSVKEPDQMDTNSSRYDPFLVPKRPFYIADVNLWSMRQREVIGGRENLFMGPYPDYLHCINCI